MLILKQVIFAQHHCLEAITLSQNGVVDFSLKSLNSCLKIIFKIDCLMDFNRIFVTALSKS